MCGGLEGDALEYAAQKLCEKCVAEEAYEDALQHASLLSSEKRTEVFAQFGETLMDAGEFEYAAAFLKTADKTSDERYAYCMAITELKKGSNADKPIEFTQKASEYLSNSGDLNNTKIFRQIIGHMDSRKYAEAYEMIDTLSGTQAEGITREEWFSILRNIISEHKPKGVADSMSAQYVLKKMDGQTDYDPSKFKDVLDSETRSALEKYPENDQEAVAGSLDNIYQSYGKNPNGKIVIVKETHGYSSGTSCTVSFGLMKHLPLEYFPKNTDEVSYVIVVSYDYRKDPTGNYMGSTQAIQETAKITVYSLEKGRAIYNSPVIYGANAPSYFTYQGVAPAYKSGGRPATGDQFIKALKTLIP